MESFDVVIIGAGPAGCVLANRLSADPSCRVLLIESGPPDKYPLIHVPKGLAKLHRVNRFMWNFDDDKTVTDTSPYPQWLRGRTLSGSSSINGMTYTRGQPSDYDEMAAVTRDDWSWARMLEAFKAIDDHGLGPSTRRGTGGPLKISAFPYDCGAEGLMEAAIQSAELNGMERREDVNDPDEAAKIGYKIRTIHKRRRQSAAVTILRPVIDLHNLVVRAGLLADRILFEGNRAVGVLCSDGDGREEYIMGRRIVPSAGSICSPALLQRSVIGAPELLASLGIPVVSACPDVERNLVAHTSITLMYRCWGPSNNSRYRGLGALLSGIRYYLFHSGPLAHAVFEATGPYKTGSDAKRPEGQIHFGPHSFIDFHKTSRRPDPQPGFMLLPFPLRPRSKGQIYIQSRDPAATPKIVYDPLADPEDRRELIAGVRLARSIVATSPLASNRPVAVPRARAALARRNGRHVRTISTAQVKEHQ